jgi:excisionase family DNA binding protein
VHTGGHKEDRVLEEEERLSLREAADALGVSEVTARRWIKSSKLKAYQPGRKYLIPRSAIDELLERESPKATAAPSLAEWLKERCGHAYLALPKGEFEEMFDQLPEDAPERRTRALEVNHEYNVFCRFPRNVPPAERLVMRRMIRDAIPEVAVKHGIALMEGGLEREYQEEAALVFDLERTLDAEAEIA